MVLAQCCDVCGKRFPREISKFCGTCGEKRLEDEVGEEELVIDDEGSMRGPLARVALKERIVNTLSYTQVFAPPSCRNDNKKYGKKALLDAKMGIQHRIMLDNYEQVKKWLKDAQAVGRLPEGPFNLEEQGLQDSLRQIIKENCKKLQEIKLGTKNHKWDEREIYKYLKHHLRYLRRKKRIVEKLKTNEEEELNEVGNSSPREENRTLFLMEAAEGSTEMVKEVPEAPEADPCQSIEDDESFLLLVLSLPTVDVMRKHLRKVIEDVNARVTPKPFGVGYRKWDKEKQVKEVAKYYRKQSLDSRL